MKWRGLPCSSESVLAYLAGTKTQTRRVVKLPKTIGDEYGEACWELAKKPSYYNGSGAIFIDLGHPIQSYPWIVECPHGVRGDGLYVREAFSSCACDACLAARPKQGPHSVLSYKADGPSPDVMKSSRYMPRWAARIFRELVEVRVERVQEITEPGIWAEGVRGDAYPNLGQPCSEDPRSARIYYMEWWDSLNAKRGHGWDTNPWVWILTTKETEQRP